MHLHGVGALALMLISAGSVLAIETESLDLRNGATNDGLVSVRRDAPGNLMFDDAFTSAPVSLSALREAVGDHGALSGLADDDHPQYMTASRHEETHGASFNNDLAISGDVNTNQTVGEHVADGAIHLKRTGNEAVTGVWDFANGVTVSGGSISVGGSAYSDQGAIGFEEGGERAELSYRVGDHAFAFNRPVNAGTVGVATLLNGRVGVARSGEIEGFASVEGIAATDLVSSTRQESIAEEWTFLGGVRTTTLTMEGLPVFVYTVTNAGGGTIAAGGAVRWAGLSGGNLTVQAASSAVSSSTPFAGFAITSAGVGDPLKIVVRGVADVVATGDFDIGDEVTWDGSNVAAGTPRIGFALENHSGSSNTKIMLSGF